MIEFRFSEILKEKPAYQTQYSAGFDLAYCGEKDLVIEGMLQNEHWSFNARWETVKVSTGVFLTTCPENYYLDLRLRSSIGKRFRLASSGVIDADYRDEILIPIQNMTRDTIIIKPGERIAQLIATPFYTVPSLERKGQRVGGFGSSGV